VLDLVKCLTIPYLYPFYTGIYLIKLTGVNLLSSNLLVTFVTEIKYLLPRDCDTVTMVSDLILWRYFIEKSHRHLCQWVRRLQDGGKRRIV